MNESLRGSNSLGINNNLVVLQFYGDTVNSIALISFNFVVFYHINYTLPLTAIFGGDEVHIANVLAARFDVMMDGVGRDRADLHEPIVLDEDRVAGEVAVDY